MKALLALAAFASACAIASQNAAAQQAPKIGDVVYEKSFDKGFSGWAAKPKGCAKTIPDGEGGSCLQISAEGDGEAGAVGNMDVLGVVDKSKSSTYMLSTGLAGALSACKGYELELEAGIKGESIPPPPKPWEGVRIAVNYATSAAPYNHCYYNMLSGSFGWMKASYRIRIPSDMKDMSMDLGLIAAKGKVCFDYVKMTVTDIPLTMKAPPPGTAWKGHELPRLRGFVTGISQPGSESGKKTLAEIANDWKANAAKLWFHFKGQDLATVDASLEKWMDSVEGCLETARRERLCLILHISAWDWHVKERGNNDLFYENPAYADKFVDAWKSIAKRFKGSKEIWAFELLNESCLRAQTAPGCPDYPELMERAAKAINEIAPERSIIVQTEEWWGPNAFYKMRPVNAKNIIYAVHFYSPFQVSHQGVGEFQGGKTSWTASAYPGTIDGLKWDKATIKRALQPARDFQKAYNAHIIVSEFSCVRWALGDSRRKLISDMIDIYEEYGWDWLYHGYPEWHGWRPELGNDPWSEKRPSQPSDIETLLKNWFAKNQKPEFKSPSQAQVKP